MKLMSVMLDLPGDVMDLNTLTKCLLDRAITMTGAQVYVCVCVCFCVCVCVRERERERERERFCGC
jgi:hypothetical protein